MTFALSGSDFADDYAEELADERDAAEEMQNYENLEADRGVLSI